MFRFGSAVFALVFALACGDDDGGGDGGGDGSMSCSEASECDDGLFCNGEETCDDNRCAAGMAPCAGTCDEDGDACGCDVDDADGDGVASTMCGGADCDDTDPRRFPGNVEICDPLGRDEDCDPSTLGPDDDGDGAPSTECCYDDPESGLTCGTDCDDSRSGVNPGAVETCNGRDDDCDGTNDEGVQVTFYRDVDGDGFGLDDDTTLECSAPTGYAVLGGDCDDALPGINPGEADGPTIGCDDEDNDCDSSVDEGCSCISGMTRGCGPTDSAGNPLTLGICRQGLDTCTAGVWGGCVGAVEPESFDICANGLDDDCDGPADEGCDCSGCACAGTTRTAPAAIVEITDRAAGVYAGYRFGWVTPDAMGRSRVDVFCHASGTQYANDRVLGTSYGPPLRVGENNHEVYMRMAGPSGSCCGNTIEVFIARM